MLFREVPVRIGKIQFLSDLFSLEMDVLEVILGMDWLGRYMAVIDCEEQSVTLSGPQVERELNTGNFLKDPRQKFCRL